MVITFKMYYDVRGRVSDCSEKPTARAGIAGRKGEDL
jgi:hypothetical protein